MFNLGIRYFFLNESWLILDYGFVNKILGDHYLAGVVIIDLKLGGCDFFYQEIRRI